MKDACWDCRFWHNEEPEKTSTGQCRRFPPTGSDSHFKTSGEPRWPYTRAQDFCGEFRAKDFWP